MELYVGTSGYSYNEWKGRFYPEALPAKRMLAFYAQHFGAVEVNHTFRRMPTPELLQKWAAEVPASFKFALKAPQRMTHVQRLKDTEDALTHFVDVAATLKSRLGPFLFQLPPTFRKDSRRLEKFLESLPPGCRAAFEFRHSSWFDDEVFDLLRRYGSALCIAEAGDDLAVPFVSTADWGYLRYRRLDYTDDDLRERWSRIQAQNWREVFVFFKHEDEAKGPGFAQGFLQLAGRWYGGVPLASLEQH